MRRYEALIHGVEDDNMERIISIVAGLTAMVGTIVLLDGSAAEGFIAYMLAFILMGEKGESE
jgi:hypothetical protein